MKRRRLNNSLEWHLSFSFPLFVLISLCYSSPLYIGGIFQTNGVDELNLRSFATFNEYEQQWNNSANSSVLSTGSINAIALIENNVNTVNNETTVKGILVGGNFNYLNHSDSSNQYGSISLWNTTSKRWDSLGYGCNGPINSIVVVVLPVTVNNTVLRNITNIIVGGYFTACFQYGDDRVTMAFNGVGYYNYDKGEWYQVPYDTPLPEGIDVFQLQIVNNNLFMVGEQTGEGRVGYAAYSPVLSSNGQLDKLNWTIFAKTGDLEDATIFAIAAADRYCYIGGDFSQLIDQHEDFITASNLAIYDIDGKVLMNVEEGVNGPVFSLALYQNELYTGDPSFPSVFISGNFDTAGEDDVKSIVQWDGAWHALGEGIVLINSTTYLDNDFLFDVQLQVMGDILYVGGVFHVVDQDEMIDNIAQWNITSQAWDSLGNEGLTRYRMLPFAISTPQSPNALPSSIFFGSQTWEDVQLHSTQAAGLAGNLPLVENLFVTFIPVNQTWANYVFNEFLLDGLVTVIRQYQSDCLVVGGAFRKIGSLTSLKNVAIFNQTSLTWFDLTSPNDTLSSSFPSGGLTSNSGGVNGVVFSLAVNGDDIYIGGIFTGEKNNQTYSNLLLWNPQYGWNVMEGGLKPTFNDSIYSVVFSLVKEDSVLFIGGILEMELRNITSYGLVGYDLANGQYIPIQDTLPPNGKVHTMVVNSTQLYIGGGFSFPFHSFLINNFARISIENITQINNWQAIVPTCNMDFDECEDQKIYSISIYSGTSSPNDGVEDNNNVTEIIFIGGNIGNINGDVMNGVARLSNNNKWMSLGDGINGLVFSMTSSNATGTEILYIGGSFNVSGSIPVHDITAWLIIDGSFTDIPSVEGWNNGVVATVINFPSPTTIPIDDDGDDQQTQDDGVKDSAWKSISISLLILLFLTILVFVIFISFVVTWQRKSKRRKYKSLSSSHADEEETQVWDEYYASEAEVPYNLLEISAPPLGRGDHGVVHKAKYKGLDVAVKIFRSEYSYSYGTKENICKYATILRSFKHPNIIHIVGGCSDPLSLVMEFSPLGTLSDILKIDPAALIDERITKIALDMAKGMKFLHSKTFLHYNLTSSNVMVTSDWTAKITDCGLLVALDAISRSRSPMSKIYSAPEVLNGEEYTASSDVYSYGMILWEMFKQTTPFVDEVDLTLNAKDRDKAFEMKIKEGGRPSCSNIPAKYAKLIKMCWATDPTHRPSFEKIVKIIIGS